MGWMGTGATEGTGGGEIDPPEIEWEKDLGRRGGEGKVVVVGVEAPEEEEEGVGGT